MIEKTLKLSISILMFLLVVLVGLQVFTRYVLSDPTSWSEEAASFLQVYMVFLGGALAMARGKTLRITSLIERLPYGFQNFIDLTMKFLIALFLIFMIWYSLFAIARLHNQIMAGLRWPKSILYASVPLGGLLMLMITLRDLRKSYLNFRSHRRTDGKFETDL